MVSGRRRSSGYKKGGVPDWRKELESGERPKGQRSAWRQMLGMPRDFDL